MALLRRLLSWWRRAVRRKGVRRRRRGRGRLRKRRRHDRRPRSSRVRRKVHRVHRKRAVRKSRVFRKKVKVRPKRKRSVPAPRVKAVEVGLITHYFAKVHAAVVKVKGTVKLGDPVWLKGTTTDFRQTVASLQIDRRPIEKARSGQEVGLEVMKDVRPGDRVYVLKT